MKNRLTLISGMFLVASVVEAAPLHCLGSQGADCEAGRCASQDTHVELIIDQHAHRAELCIGESCYTGSLRLATTAGVQEGVFSGSDPLKRVFTAHVAVSVRHDAATVTWGDGVALAMVFVRCREAP